MLYFLLLASVLPAQLPLWLLWTFDVDLTGMMSTAESLFNQLFPAFVVVIGILLAMGLIGMIINAISKAVRGGGRA
jgi:hypothetical protein